MSKRNRNRQRDKVFPNFPYARKFTAAEQELIMARQQRLVEAFRDAVGIQGWVLGLPEDHLQLLMFHGALAGVDVDPDYPPDRAFIRPRRIPDRERQFVDAVEWVLTKEDTPRARHRDARREARAHMTQLEQQLDPAVREAMAEMFAAKANRAAARLADDPEDERDELTTNQQREETEP